MKLGKDSIVSEYNLELVDSKPMPMRRGGTISPSNGVPLIVTGFR